MSEPIVYECDHMQFMVCPHCGYDDQDTDFLTLFKEIEAEVECEECNGVYLVTVHYEPDFTTKKKTGDDTNN